MIERPHHLHEGDCVAFMRDQLEPGSIETIITDPPYEIAFMGKTWDGSGVAFQPETWAAALQVAKPGATLLAFGGTRTWHRLAVAIEDAGWEVRDTIMWLYGSGFPKSHDISKAIDKAAGAEREVIGMRRDGAGNGSVVGLGSDRSMRTTYEETAPATAQAERWQGYGTALKPAWEPIIVAMKPRAGTFASNALEHGVAGLNIDAARISTDEDTCRNSRGESRIGTFEIRARRADEKPMPSGRWPANVVLDEDAAAMLDQQAGLLTSGSEPPGGLRRSSDKFRNTYGAFRGAPSEGSLYGDSGGASRFFYCAKASRAEREYGLSGLPEKRIAQSNGAKAAAERGEDYQGPDGSNGFNKSRQRRNTHPTVKPLDLMIWLCRLTRPPAGGTILDPFAGSGTTGIAAARTARNFIGCEITPEYAEIARERLRAAYAQPTMFGPA